MKVKYLAKTLNCLFLVEVGYSNLIHLLFDSSYSRLAKHPSVNKLDACVGLPKVGEFVYQDMSCTFHSKLIRWHSDSPHQSS
jgi:hypothetical protein